MPHVEDGKVVTIHFTLTANGEIADSTAEGDPISYLHGAQNIVPGLEAALGGRTAGDRVRVSVSPEDGYGPRSDQPPLKVPRTEFPPDMPLQVGVPIGGEDAEGNLIPFWITHVDADTVVVDPNHPLAGHTLEFDVEILSVDGGAPVTAALDATSLDGPELVRSAIAAQLAGATAVQLSGWPVARGSFRFSARGSPRISPVSKL